ncbi:hypothetical protein LTR99_003727 [Exophiala xenobiotica]|uniref:Chitin deacetylase n=1 Tax=Vermiconidia calcicola TaxID=1690605 RepID=A0AAV9Q0I8_9PEZI|nr:hypothetical protein LTR92_008619 [Exophiala xenobiotica]KAK5531420.1 hypothetical protein LTR25_008529 [Vermiconidia calcicola]KAK5544793.1 hypothetical protein LTR23_004233 [Chaetothyriales sp. CCFEE 6169]KAK5218271.1 hypothetical protein LTR72_008872 [Exophiala xenobiotica]KAK5222479.1 hypothetical protein LTR47_010472 [Exophiala xenobiotica]
MKLYSVITWVIFLTLEPQVQAKVAPLKVLGGRDVLANLQPFQTPHRDPLFGPTHDQVKHSLVPRKWKNPPSPTAKKCGPGVGYCDPGYCCSIGGNCGKGYHYCSGPACQLGYSDGCDANQKPLGAETLAIERPLIGNVSYEGVGISQCVSSDHIALTFDDGPYNFTWHLLDVLASYNAKATFFVTGNNLGKGQMDVEETGYPALIRRMHADGHQIASHTWTHQNLTEMSEEHMINQMHYNEMAFRNILGFFPTYMRPPYSECNSTCQAIMKKMGYHITLYTLVTHDYLYDDPTLIQTAKDSFVEQMEQAKNLSINTVAINHDILYQTAYNLTNYMLDYMKFLNYGTSVTVGECLGDPPENWYRTAGGAPPAAALVSPEQPVMVQQCTEHVYFRDL